MKDYFKHPSKGWGWWDTSERPSRSAVSVFVREARVGAPIFAMSEAEVADIERLKRECDEAMLEARVLHRRVAYLEEHNQFKQCREWHEWAGKLLHMSDTDTHRLSAEYKRGKIGELVTGLRSMALGGAR